MGMEKKLQRKDRNVLLLITTICFIKKKYEWIEVKRKTKKRLKEIKIKYATVEAPKRQGNDL